MLHLQNQKTLNSNQTLAISSQTTIEKDVISLGKADIFNLDAVYMAAVIFLLMRQVVIQTLPIDLN